MLIIQARLSTIVYALSVVWKILQDLIKQSCLLDKASLNCNPISTSCVTSPPGAHRANQHANAYVFNVYPSPSAKAARIQLILHPPSSKHGEVDLEKQPHTMCLRPGLSRAALKTWTQGLPQSFSKVARICWRAFAKRVKCPTTWLSLNMFLMLALLFTWLGIMGIATNVAIREQTNTNT